MGERTRMRTTKLSDEFRKLLKEEFADPLQPSAYGRKHKLASAVRDKGGHVSAKWLQSQDFYTLHSPFARRFPHRPTIVSRLRI